MAKKTNVTADDLGLGSLLELPKMPGMITELRGQQIVEEENKKAKKNVAKKQKPTQTKHAAPVSEGTGNSWDAFLKYAEEYQKPQDKGVLVWIDTDVKTTLDRVRNSRTLGFKTRTMVSAILRAFIEENKDRLREIISGESNSLI